MNMQTEFCLPGFAVAMSKRILSIEKKYESETAKVNKPNEAMAPQLIVIVWRFCNYKIHYLRIFEFELFERQFVYLSMKMNYHILSNEPKRAQNAESTMIEVRVPAASRVWTEQTLSMNTERAQGIIICI